MKSVRGRSKIEMKDFSGGLVTKSPPKNIDLKYSVDCHDVYSEGAILTKRLGVTLLNPTAASGNGNGLYNWVRGSKPEEQWLMGYFGSSLYKMDITGGVWDGDWDLVEGALGWDAYTKLMLHCDGTDAATTFTDEIGNTVTAVGNAQIDTAQKKFGTASLLVDGTGDYLTVPDSDDWSFGSGDFTIDFNVRFASLAGETWLFSQHEGDSANALLIRTNAANKLEFTLRKNDSQILNITDTATVTTATWIHVAVVRNSNNFTLYKNGTSVASSTSDETLPNISAVVAIGAEATPSPTAFLDGWMDEIRVSKGTARWTANFTVPTAAYAQSNITFFNSKMYFSNFNGVLIMSTDSWDDVKRMTTSESSFQNVITGGSGTAPKSKFVFNWKNHAWYVNVKDNEDQVVHSSVNSYNNFTGSTYGTNTLFTENDIGLTGGFLLNGRLYITKAFSIHRFTYTGTPSPLVEIKPMKSTIGTKSPRSIRNVDTPEGEVVLFLGTDKKLYRCDGVDTAEITDSLDITNSQATVYMQNINENALNACWAQVHLGLNWYELFLCIGTATVPNYSLVYDYKYKSFWPMTNRSYSYGAVADNGSGKRVVYAQGNTNGKAYLTHSSNSDDGTSISALWTSPKIGDSIILSKMDEIEVETGAVACTPTFSWRADWETSWISQTMSSGTNSHNWSPGRVDNMIQFKIEDDSVNPPFKLWTILGSERAVGGGK